MNQQEAIEGLKMLHELALKLPRSVPDFKNPVVFNFWASEVLPPLELSRVREICKTLAMTCEFFPSAKEFLSVYDGVASKDDEVGMEIVAKIELAIANPGAAWEPANPPVDMWAKLTRVKEMVGPMGWDFIQTRGGWWSFVNGLDEGGISDYHRNSWAKAITASYKQHRAFGPNPPPIGLPGAARPALNESSDIIDVKEIRAAPSSGLATKALAAAAAETAGERTTSQKVSLLSGLRAEIEHQVLAKRKAAEESCGAK